MHNQTPTQTTNVEKHRLKNKCDLERIKMFFSLWKASTHPEITTVTTWAAPEFSLGHHWNWHSNSAFSCVNESVKHATENFSKNLMRQHMWVFLPLTVTCKREFLLIEKFYVRFLRISWNCQWSLSDANGAFIILQYSAKN